MFDRVLGADLRCRRHVDPSRGAGGDHRIHCETASRQRIRDQRHCFYFFHNRCKSSTSPVNFRSGSFTSLGTNARYRPINVIKCKSVATHSTHLVSPSFIALCFCDFTSTPLPKIAFHTVSGRNQQIYTPLSWQRCKSPLINLPVTLRFLLLCCFVCFLTLFLPRKPIVSHASELCAAPPEWRVPERNLHRLHQQRPQPRCAGLLRHDHRRRRLDSE